MTNEEVRLRRGLQLLADEAPSVHLATSAREEVRPKRTEGLLRPRSIVPILAAAAAVGLIVLTPAILPWDSDSQESPTTSPNTPTLQLMLGEPVVFGNREFSPVSGQLTKDAETGCVLLDGVPLLAPIGSTIVDESHVYIAGYGTRALGDTLEGMAHRLYLERSYGRPEEGLADQFLTCMGKKDRLDMLEFK